MRGLSSAGEATSHLSTGEYLSQKPICTHGDVRGHRSQALGKPCVRGSRSKLLKGGLQKPLVPLMGPDPTVGGGRLSEQGGVGEVMMWV